jgi:hypothetical protein
VQKFFDKPYQLKEHLPFNSLILPKGQEEEISKN